MGEGRRPGHGELHTEGAASSAQTMGTWKDGRVSAGAAAVQGRAGVGSGGPLLTARDVGVFPCFAPAGAPGGEALGTVGPQTAAQDVVAHCPRRQPAAFRIPVFIVLLVCVWGPCGSPSALSGLGLSAFPVSLLLSVYVSCPFFYLLGSLALPCLLLRMKGALTPCATHPARCPGSVAGKSLEGGGSQECRHAHRGVGWVLPMYEGES